MGMASLRDMRLLAAVSFVLADIVGTVCLSPTDVGLEILQEHHSYMVAVGYYETGVQVVGMPLFGVLFVVVPDSEFDFERLDRFYIARFADRQRPSVPAPAVGAAAATISYQLVG